MIVICPPFKPVPPGATEDDRRRMYEDYLAELRRLNPAFYRRDGKPRTIWEVCLAVLFGIER